MSTFDKKSKNKLADESALSRNHSKSVRFRLRVQQELEANNEIKEYKDEEIDEEYYRSKND